MCLLFYSLAKLEADDADNEDATDEAFRNLQDEKIKVDEFLKVRTGTSKLSLRFPPALECIGFSRPTPCKARCSLCISGQSVLRNEKAFEVVFSFKHAIGRKRIRENGTR